MAQSTLMCLHVCKQCSLQCTTIIHYKGDIIYIIYNLITEVDMTIKLCSTTNPTTSTFTTELYVCKQQHTPTAN